MSSLIEGYNYDIFISYRQKDNKGDRWVSEFVEALKTELESTFKEEISVYFDINPHEGILDTHDVDASLQEKLKCLILIPIISRTYCDPKSFAWRSEFMTFFKQASDDQFGLKVKLSGGNIASRILPVQIHELNQNDRSLIEGVIGSPLRPIDFIYREPGVNRPLKPDDDDKLNLSKTKYRNQINKTSNAIEEIINSLSEIASSSKVEIQESDKQISTLRKTRRKDKPEKPVKLSHKKVYSVFAILTIMVVTALFIYRGSFFKKESIEKQKYLDGKISIAVMPFRNMTNDSIWDIWQEGIQTSLVNFLYNSYELVIREFPNDLIQSGSQAGYASLTSSVVRNIAKKLDAELFITGNIIKTGETIRVNAQIFDTGKKEAIKSFERVGPAKEEIFFLVVDSLRNEVKDFLIVTKLEIDNLKRAHYTFDPVSSPDAYRYMVAATEASNPQNAIELYMKALDIDSNLYDAYQLIATSYAALGDYENVKKWTLKYYSKYDELDNRNRLFADYYYALVFKNPYEAIRYCEQLINLNDQSPLMYLNLGDEYWKLFQYDRAIPEYEKAFEIYKRWGRNPHVEAYTLLGGCYHKTEQYKKEKKLYRNAEKIFPENLTLITMQAILALTEGDNTAAEQYIENIRSISKDNRVSEARILRTVALIYREAGIFNEAEKYYRQAVQQDPQSLSSINSLAYFLIDRDRNINEGLELIEKALNSQPESYNYLHTKGWGLYKQGNLPQALEILQRSWDLRLKNAIYNHEAFLHLEEAKKAVASSKNN